MGSRGCGKGGYEDEAQCEESVEKKPDGNPSSRLEIQQWRLGLLVAAHLAAILIWLNCSLNIAADKPIIISHKLRAIRGKNEDSEPELTERQPMKPGTSFVPLPAPFLLSFARSEADYLHLNP